MEIPRESSLEAVHGLEGLTLELKHAGGVREQQLPCPRRLRSATETIEEPDAQLLLERANVLGDGGLGEPERLGRLREGLELGHLHENLELSQVHGAKYRRVLACCLPREQETIG